jgi:hypothetical protein
VLVCCRNWLVSLFVLVDIRHQLKRKVSPTEKVTILGLLEKVVTVDCWR